MLEVYSKTHLSPASLSFLNQAFKSTLNFPPDTMNPVKILKGWPLQDAPSELVQLWYKSFQKADSVAGFLRKTSSEQDFEYLY